jgi:predicted Fe-Mo cluster-binding NifX family protein
LQGVQLDGIVVGGIGMGALNKLAAAGIRVFLAQQGTVKDTIEAFKAGMLRPVTPGMTCAGQGHRHRHGCGH